MKKKKLLFYGYTMQMGGAERALINVINVIKDYFDIDLILLEAKGELLKEIDKSVNITEIRKNIFSYILFRYIPFFRKRKINKLTYNKKYDIACAFMEGRAATWLTDMKDNCYKIAWVHNDVFDFSIGISDKEIIKTYNKLDKIYVVSIQSMEHFCSKYNISRDKVQVIYNLIDEEDVLTKAKLEKIKKDKFTFVNVAKMRNQKRHDRLLECAYNLKKDGYDFNLWLVGNGPLFEDVKKQVNDLDLNDVVKLWGLKENPYPYVAAADYFVMSSDHEGYPLSLLESLLLKTPVISTNVSGASEILKDGKYGIICDISTEGLTNAMKDAIDNPHKEFKSNLEKYIGNNENIIKQLLKIFKVK